MAAFTPIPSLVTFTPLTTILSADVNSNFASIRTQFNNLVPSQNTLAVDTLTENTLNSGVTVNKKFAVSAGIASFASGIAITAGVVSGLATFSSGVAISGGTVNVSGITVSGIATFSSGFAISAGVVSGVATLSSGLSITGGTATCGVALNVSGAFVASSTASLIGTLTLGANVITNTTLANGSASFQNSALSTAGANDFTISPTFNSIGNDLTALRIAVTDTNSAPGAKVISAGVGINTIFRVPKEGGAITQALTLATNATRGFLYIPTMPATASGTPNPETGTVALAYETTGNHLMVFNGAAWKQVALA